MSRVSKPSCLMLASMSGALWQRDVDQHEPIAGGNQHARQALRADEVGVAEDRERRPWLVPLVAHGAGHRRIGLEHRGSSRVRGVRRVRGGRGRGRRPTPGQREAQRQDQGDGGDRVHGGSRQVEVEAAILSRRLQPRACESPVTASRPAASSTRSRAPRRRRRAPAGRRCRLARARRPDRWRDHAPVRAAPPRSGARRQRGPDGRGRPGTQPTTRPAHAPGRCEPARGRTERSCRWPATDRRKNFPLRVATSAGSVLNSTRRKWLGTSVGFSTACRSSIPR